MTDSKITIKIRSNDPANSEKTVVCESNWNVKKLKETAHKDCPDLDINHVQYIYCGRFLSDNALLKSIFKVSSEPPVIQMYSTHFQHIPNVSSVPNMSPSTVEGVNPTELRHRHTLPNLASMPSMTHSWSTEQLSTYYHQHAWHHYNQAMSQYMQYYQSAYTGYPLSTSFTPTIEPQNPETQVNNAQQNDADQVPPPEANPPMNAQGGFAAVDDDDQQNDWLDVLFTMLRGGFFLSILYFYSTLYRLVFVAFLFAIGYIYQAGFFQPQRRVAVNNHGEEQQPESTDDNNNMPENNAENATAGQQVQPEQPSVFEMAWCFVKTFFTSLIPQGPGAVAN